MRTNVTVDEQLVEAVRVAAGVTTKAKAVVEAMQEYLRWHRIGMVRRYQGKARFRRDTAEVRHRGR